MKRSSLIPAAAGALALSMQGAIAASSTAETDACLEESGAVRACSTKELSNVVVQCDGVSGPYFVKYDELDDGTYEGLIDPYSGSFTCPHGDEVLAVFIKSGNNRYLGTIEGLPRGSGGAEWKPFPYCSEDQADCSSSDEGGDEGGDENTDPPG